MSYYFSNPIGIILALFFLIIAAFIVGLTHDFSFKETVLTGIGYLSWYALTLFISSFLPQLDILAKNHFLYMICSVTVLAIATEYLKDKLY